MSREQPRVSFRFGDDNGFPHGFAGLRSRRTTYEMYDFVGRFHYPQGVLHRRTLWIVKQDLAVRPIYHQRDDRIDAHIFVAFIAYCLQVTLKHRLRTLAPGLTPRAVLEKFASLQMVDVHLPTTDGRTLILPRYTEPEKEQKLLLQRLRLQLPAQPPPRISHADPQRQSA